jgi:hypothetical protein
MSPLSIVKRSVMVEVLRVDSLIVWFGVGIFRQRSY